jgi:hypothetical protein
MVQWKTEGTRLYQQLPGEMFETWKECEPLREICGNNNIQDSVYKTWKENKK